MNKNIKYLIENLYNKFDITDYQDKEDDIINHETIKNISYDKPKNKEELIEILKKRIKENAFGDDSLYYPDFS